METTQIDIHPYAACSECFGTGRVRAGGGKKPYVGLCPVDPNHFRDSTHRWVVGRDLREGDLVYQPSTELTFKIVGPVSYYGVALCDVVNGRKNLDLYKFEDKDLVTAIR